MTNPVSNQIGERLIWRLGTMNFNCAFGIERS